MSEFDFDDEERDPVTSGKAKSPLAYRFRGFLPVVVDVETGGFDPIRDALLEVAFVFIDYDELQGWQRVATENYHIEPFKNSNIDPGALSFNKIDPNHPFRFIRSLSLLKPIAVVVYSQSL